MLSIYLSLIDSAADKNKFEELYNMHKRTMLYKARDILKDDHLAEDAVHEAFLRVIKNFTKIDEVDSPQMRAFLVIIVRNVSLTLLDKLNRETFIEDVELFSNEHSEIEDSVFDRIECEKIIEALEELPVQYRDILYLQYMEEYKLKEIAALFNMSNEVVKKRAQRGKKKLLELLDARSAVNGKSKAGS